jgi:serine-type D-Ala-D-Ala endopeptidase (penicillin-binding protein 7)
MQLLKMLSCCACLSIAAATAYAQPNNETARYDDNVTIAYPYVDDRPAPEPAREVTLRREAKSDPAVMASSVLVMDQKSGEVLFDRNANYLQPIASITKLMTAMVVLNAEQPLEQFISVTADDVAATRPTHSRLKAGARLTRDELLRLMLMASENRAAAALARSFPGGLTHFVKRMNDTAEKLGLLSTSFADPSGLDPANRSTARDLAALVQHAYRFDRIREYSTTPEYAVSLRRARMTTFHNTNRLTRSADWDIGLSKTGYITASGQCLVLQAAVAGRPLIMVILDSSGKGGRIEDAIKLRSWLEHRDDRWVVARM